jgi:hypothetical protein
VAGRRSTTRRAKPGDRLLIYIFIYQFWVLLNSIIWAARYVDSDS